MSAEGRADEEFKAFFLTNRPKIINAILACSDDRQLAEEVAQDTLMVLRHHWGRYDHPEILMYRVARQHLIKRIRRIPAQVELPAERLEDLEYLTPVGRSDEAQQVAERVDLIRALRMLPVRQREVLVFEIICDLSQKQVAQVLGISESAVKTHKSRGLSRLHEILQGPLTPAEPGAEQQLGGIV